MTNTEGKPKPKGQMDRAARIIGGGTGRIVISADSPASRESSDGKAVQAANPEGRGLELTRAATDGTFLGFWR